MLCFAENQLMMTKKKPETKLPKRKTADTDNVRVEDELGTKGKRKKIKVEVSREYVHQRNVFTMT